MSDLVENFKKLPKWAWFAIGGGFLLVAYLSSKKQVTYAPTPVYDNPNLSDSKVSEGEMASQFNQLIGDLSNSFEDQLQEQGAYFNQAISEKDKQRQEEIQALNTSWETRVNGLTSSFLEQQGTLQNQLADISSHLIPSPVYTPPVVSDSAPSAPSAPIWKSDSFKTGTFNDQQSAEKIAQVIKSTYGGSNVQVINEGGVYRVTSEFTQDQGKAERVLDKLKERGLIGTGYVQNGVGVQP